MTPGVWGPIIRSIDAPLDRTSTPTGAASAAASSDGVAETSAGIRKVIDNVKRVIYIDTRKLEYILAAKIAGGHVILADSHGVGKTSLAKALSGSIRWHTQPAAAAQDHQGAVHMDHFSRIQCTVDLLPQDILGFNRYETATGTFQFMQGPIFAHFVLCDEINLLTPKTQGSFFQAMEEQAVSVEGQTFELAPPFFIIATMNLKGAHLFPLPAPQLDRFMIRLSIGYPSAQDEVAIVQQHGRENSWADFAPVVDSTELLGWQRKVDQIGIHAEVVDYLVRCVRQTRQHPAVETGASPRTGVKLSRMARALAMVRGEDFVTVDLIKEILLPAVAHRLIMEDPATPAESILEEILKSVRVEPAHARSS